MEAAGGATFDPIRLAVGQQGERGVDDLPERSPEIDVRGVIRPAPVVSVVSLDEDAVRQRLGPVALEPLDVVSLWPLAVRDRTEQVIQVGACLEGPLED